MKRIIAIIFFAIPLLSVQAQHRAGTIKGSLQNPKKEPLSGVSVVLNNHLFNTITNTDGEFVIYNVPEGKYTLTFSSVGYNISKENVVVKSAGITQVDLQLNELTKELAPVTVRSVIPNRYITKTSSSGLRLPLDLTETPQSVQVVSQQLIQDQAAQNLNDVTKNMVGVITNNNYSSFTIRGFSTLEATSTNNFIAYDGMLGNMYYWQQTPFLYNIDHVESIGGPAAALYSVGSPGGMFNMVTKKPLDHPYLSYNITTGSWGLIDASLDMGGPLSKDKKLQYRLNIGANNQNSINQYQYTNNIVLAPSLVYHFNDKTDLSVDYVRNDYHTRDFEFWGGAVLMKADSTYDWKHIIHTTAFYSTADFAVTHNNSLSVTFNHNFNQNFKLSYVSRYTHASLNTAGFSGTFYSGTNYFTSYPDSVPRQYSPWQDQTFNFMNSLYTTAKFGTTQFNHTLVTGVDLQYYGGQDYYGLWYTAPSVSFLNPNYSNDIYTPALYPDSTAAYIQHNKNRTLQFGPYVEDIISIGKHIKMLLAARYETYLWLLKPNGQDNYTQTNDSSVAHVLIPRAGFVYNLNKNHTVYASYCESYQPQYDNGRAQGGPFPPQVGQQEEVGYKGLWLDGKLLTTVALYNIYWKNQLTPSPINPNLSIVVPGLFSRGAEFTAQANLDHWNFQGSYAYNNEVFSVNSPLGNKGDRFDNSPHSIANAWIKYSFADYPGGDGLSLMLGGKYVSKRLGSTLYASKFLMPDYFVLDAAVNYHYKRYDFALNGYNLTNTVYIPGWYASDFMVMPGNPINWKLSIRYTLK